MGRFICLLFLVMIINGCTTMPTDKELANLDYGPPPTIDYEREIKNYFGRVLSDPYSAHYSLEAPRQCWYKASSLSGGELYSGHIVLVGVSERNRMGGYVRTRTYGFLFKNNDLIRVFNPQEVATLILSNKLK